MTTRIEFHFNAPERLQYACRLLRKAHGRSLRVGVVGAQATLRQLDAALWTFSATDFCRTAPRTAPQTCSKLRPSS